MKISKLFHWLYAILMFLPFGFLVFNSLASMWSGGVVDFATWSGYFVSFFEDIFTNSGLSGEIYNVFEYLIFNIFGLDSWLVSTLLMYWTCISIIWLVFDVFMYVPLLVHRWIDKAKIE